MTTHTRQHLIGAALCLAGTSAFASDASRVEADAHAATLSPDQIPHAAPLLPSDADRENTDGLASTAAPVTTAKPLTAGAASETAPVTDAMRENTDGLASTTVAGSRSDSRSLR